MSQSRRYLYVAPNLADIAVISNGPDGQSGTEDDIRP